MTFTVAIVGRPNVGKSTLFNRLSGKRQALVDDMPGVTRDRREAEGALGPLSFRILDTAGLEEADKTSLQGRMTAMTEAAIREADVTLFVIDGRVGLTPTDEHFANMLRRSKKPVVLAVNKAEGGKVAASTVAEAYRLGFGDPIPISAEHGDGLMNLYDALEPFSDEKEEEEAQAIADSVMTIAIVGRPNVGKSTLFNQILGYERTLTGPEAGITRDAIAVECEFEGKKLKLIDTAGMRRKSNVTGKVEKLAVADTLDALRFAHVAIWLIDANQPLEKQDNTIASHIEQEGRALVLGVNKWDEVDDPAAWLKALNQRLEKVLQQSKGVTLVPLSAKTGMGVDKLLKACFRAYELWNTELSTGELNRWLEHALQAHTPPLIDGRRLKIRYMTQKTARPPTFLLFANRSDIPDHYLRYLVNGMRESFELPGVPIRIKIRKNKNPYADD